MKTTGPDFATAMDVRRRDGECCVRCGKVLLGRRGTDWSLQHRKPRGMGGTSDPTINSPANLLSVCGNGTTGCHGWMESHRLEAHDKGWLLWQNSDPQAVAVLVDAGRRWVYLDDEAAYVDSRAAS